MEYDHDRAQSKKVSAGHVVSSQNVVDRLLDTNVILVIALSIHAWCADNNSDSRWMR